MTILVVVAAMAAVATWADVLTARTRAAQIAALRETGDFATAEWLEASK